MQIDTYTTSMAKLYYSDSCHHSFKLLELVKKRPSLNITLVDTANTTGVDVKAVPTIVLSNGVHLVGQKAFEYVEMAPEKQYTCMLTNTFIGVVLVYILYRYYKS